MSRNKLIIGLLVILLLAVAPLFFSDFRMNLLGKFLAFAILAVGLDLIWGYTGILSLGHGVFFGLGAYCIAMYLKLEASTGKLPDFMSWSGLEEMPWFWVPFGNPFFAILAAVGVPMILAGLIGYFTFRNRIKGVFFSILSQAVVIVMVTLFIGKQAYTGGTNGLTGFRTVFGFPLSSPSVKLFLYYLTLVVLIVAYFLCRKLVNSRTGKILVAIRDGESRVRFSGYDPTTYKVFVYTLSAGLAGLAGILFVLQVGIISPAMMGIIPSVEMVLWVAVGGRGTLIGAVIGAVLTNGAKSFFSESFPDIWLYFLGALFVIVVLFLPQGVVGVFAKAKQKFAARKVVDEVYEHNSLHPKHHG
ncbi:urea ABC transporter permease subunit UrtC [Effusibacillus consociatus]|uniref:Urea ABC transporter permease subunit UrtC n=1 Tax=Effusibacillus consociatus TaxID=1117041 RepID=A0ABV9PV84_9BACL